MPLAKNKFISSIVIFAFIFNIVVPDASACWWKGLPRQTPGVEGGPEGGGGHDDGKPGNAGNGDIVYLHNGDFVYEHVDLKVPSRAINLEIKRTYKAQSKFNGQFGLGWEMNYNKRVVPLSNGDLFYLDGEGLRHRFTYLDGTNYVSPSEVFDKLVQNQDGTYTLTKKDGTKYKFNQNGTISEIVDRNNNTMRFTYDPQGKLPIIGVPLYTNDPVTKRLLAYQYKLIKITDTVEREINLSYDDDGRVNKISDFTGREIIYLYNDLGHMTSAKDPAGNITQYDYDADRNLRTITDPKGNIFLTNTYNPKEKVIAQVFGNDTFYFSYNTAQRITDFTDRAGNTWAYHFDVNGDPTKIIDPDGNETIMTYDTNNRMLLASKVYPRGNWVKYSYDDKGNFLEIRRKKIGAADVDDPANDIVTSYTYEPRFNQIKTITDPRGNATTYTYDYELPPADPNYGENGNCIKIAYPTVNTLTPETNITYNSYGQVETVIDPNGNMTKYEYFTETGYLKKIVRGLGSPNEAETVFSFDDAGNVKTITDPNGNTTSFTHNMLNQLTTVMAPPPFNYVTNYTYDKNGNLEKVERQTGITASPWQTTTYTYTSLDQLETIADNLGNVTAIGYDANDNIASIRDAELNTTTYEYDKRNLLLKVTDAKNAVTYYTYDENKNLFQIQNAKGKFTTYSYDDFDRLKERAYHNGSTEFYDYDKAGNLTAKTTRSGDTISYTYDDLNRLTDKITPETTNTYTHDVGSRLKTATYSAGTISYAYDELNRVKSVSYPGDKNVSYEYDTRGSRTKLTYPDNSYITYLHDEISRLTEIKNEQGQVIAHYDYDALSRRTSASYLNGTSVDYAYDAISRLEELTNNYNPVPTTHSYTYDSVGNRLTHTSLRGGEFDQSVYTYDDIYQLTNVTYPDTTSTTYNYDLVGNRDSTVNGGITTYIPNTINQYVSVGGVTFAYDANGNLTNDGTNTYTYDSENRLTTFVIPAKAGIYTYDPFGRRITKNVDGTITTYLHDGDQVICEYDGTDTLTAKYTYGPGIDEPITMERGGQTYYYHFDALGSVTALTDSAGNLTEEYTYDIFGKVTSSLSEVGNPYYFTGRRYDEETGLYYYRARMYNPQIGRFLQTDPIGYFAGMNLYTYVNNNPVNWVDPLGLCKDKPGEKPDPTGPKPGPDKPEPGEEKPDAKPKPGDEKPEPKPQDPTPPDPVAGLKGALDAVSPIPWIGLTETAVEAIKAAPAIREHLKDIDELGKEMDKMYPRSRK